MDCFALGAILVAVVLSLVQQLHGDEQMQIHKTRMMNNACDIFEGSWVYDESYPLYETSRDCPFIEREFDCQNNGRPDRDYLKFRWQPTACDFPRSSIVSFSHLTLTKSEFRVIEGTAVGDSLSLNQWQSLTCMLHKTVPQAKYISERNGGLSTFTFPTYNAKVMFSRNAFLVDIVNTSSGRVLKLDSIESGKLWKNIDVLIFNTWHWWLHTGRKQPWDLIEDGKLRVRDMDRLVAFEKALKTWAKWVETNVDPTKTNVFFQGVSPDHTNGSQWRQPNVNCVGQTQPVSGSIYPGGPNEAELVAEKVISGISKPVYLLKGIGDKISSIADQDLASLCVVVAMGALAVTTTAALAYNVSVIYSRNALLVDIVGDQKAGRVLKLNSISSGETWKGFDTLIFDTWHWWLHTGRKQAWDMIQDANNTYKDMDRLVAYGKAMKTWANWVYSNVDSSKTKIFLQGISPDHINSTQWGDPNAKTCKGETKPLLGNKYPGGPHPAQATVEKVLKTIHKKVYLLDITTLSQLRKDGHPSVYGFGGRRGNDCTHWCLPGVPDTWNQLLYASLIRTQH
ncbi:hypothetical protein JRO89_XS04G0080100 [Xanthoceras sorbifolium]|uniref:Trichome birefringence-like N-terminal domain-containing protein n=1 Tax=Xanthoceras sorbifolium TaxID=99658 RepID=A0ABQ8I4K8_9ROSI|nr:hypothetical protein JRO89_XS04G0080100 [Xanthoceras sorbifolium]